jgi:hypothetical protein
MGAAAALLGLKHLGISVDQGAPTDVKFLEEPQERGFLPVLGCSGLNSAPRHIEIMAWGGAQW